MNLFVYSSFKQGRGNEIARREEEKDQSLNSSTRVQEGEEKEEPEQASQFRKR